jgi:hypothetical protein
MHEPLLNSDWGAILVSAPFLVLLIAGFLRLDSLLSAPRHKRRAHPATDFDRNGELFFTDPDGHPGSRRAGEAPNKPVSGNSKGSKSKPLFAHDCKCPVPCATRREFDAENK